MRDVLEATNEKRSDGGPAVRTAVKWLVEFLTDMGGAAEPAAVKEAGRAAGHSASSIERAGRLLQDKGRMAVEKAGFPAKTHWLLQENATPA